MSAQRWVALQCGDETLVLLKNHPNAFLLLTQIAMRAKWKDCPITNLKKGQSWIGDYKAAGIETPKAYRHAQKVLQKCGLVAFRGTNKGTVATLTNSDVFSLSAPTRGEREGNQGASKGQTKGEQGATIHIDTQNTQSTPFALDGASSAPPQKISWSPEHGFTLITAQDRAAWAEAYPAVNIDRQLAAASEWLKSNPAKAKKNLWRKFITGWLSRAQERGGDIPSNSPSQAPAGTYVSGGRAFKV